MKTKTLDHETVPIESETWEHSEGADLYEKIHHLPARRLHRRILVVDDEVHFTHLVKMHLEDTGRFEVAVVSETDEVMTVARRFEPDLILLDIVMPGKDGGDVAAQLRLDRKLKDVPIIFVTALVAPSETSNGDKMVRKGDRRMLSKPVRSKVLIATIDAVLRRLSPPRRD